MTQTTIQKHKPNHSGFPNLKNEPMNNINKYPNVLNKTVTNRQKDCNNLYAYSNRKNKSSNKENKTSKMNIRSLTNKLYRFLYIKVSQKRQTTIDRGISPIINFPSTNKIDKQNKKNYN